MTDDTLDALLRSMNDVPNTKQALEEALAKLAAAAAEHPADRRIYDVQHIMTMELTGIEYMERVQRGEV